MTKVISFQQAIGLIYILHDHFVGDCCFDSLKFSYCGKQCEPLCFCVSIGVKCIKIGACVNFRKAKQSTQLFRAGTQHKRLWSGLTDNKQMFSNLRIRDLHALGMMEIAFTLNLR